MTLEERNQLEANLAAEGCRDALVVWNGILLDGHNRLETCTRLRIPYKTCEINLPNREAAKLWVEENQMGRRNLTPDQRAAIAYRVLQRRVEISKCERARKGGLAGGSGRPKLSLVVAPSTKQKRRLREGAASQLGVSERRIRAVGELVKKSPTVLQKVADGTWTIKEAKRRVLEEVRRKQNEAALRTNPKGHGIHTGDFTILESLLEDNSVDLILTDPPYIADSIPLFGRLAKLAQAKLKPGGFALVCTGTYHLPAILREMTKHLDYYWMLVVRHSGQPTRMWSRKIQPIYYPLLMLSKRPAPRTPANEWLSDCIDGQRDKQHHEWGKSHIEFGYWIKRLTLPGQLVVDPFVGGGPVPLACVANRRRFIGTELDPGVAAAARARIAAFRKSNKGC